MKSKEIVKDDNIKNPPEISKEMTAEVDGIKLYYTNINKTPHYGGNLRNVL